MNDSRLASIRAQIDAEDAVIIAAVKRRNYWVRKAQEGNAVPVQRHTRENEIYRTYREGLGYPGMLIATAVLRSGRSAVYAAQEARDSA